MKKNNYIILFLLILLVGSACDASNNRFFDAINTIARSNKTAQEVRVFAEHIAQEGAIEYDAIVEQLSTGLDRSPNHVNKLLRAFKDMFIAFKPTLQGKRDLYAKIERFNKSIKNIHHTTPDEQQLITRITVFFERYVTAVFERNVFCYSFQEYCFDTCIAQPREWIQENKLAASIVVCTLVCVIAWYVLQEKIQHTTYQHTTDVYTVTQHSVLPQKGSTCGHHAIKNTCIAMENLDERQRIKKLRDPQAFVAYLNKLDEKFKLPNGLAVPNIELEDIDTILKKCTTLPYFLMDGIDIFTTVDARVATRAGDADVYRIQTMIEQANKDPQFRAFFIANTASIAEALKKFNSKTSVPPYHWIAGIIGNGGRTFEIMDSLNIDWTKTSLFDDLYKLFQKE